MMSEIPKGFGKIKEEDPRKSDTEIARIGLIAELDAINLYEQLEAIARDPILKKTLKEIAMEEKVHVGEFLEILKRLDPEQVKAIEDGANEVKEKDHP